MCLWRLATSFFFFLTITIIYAEYFFNTEFNIISPNVKNEKSFFYINNFIACFGCFSYLSPKLEKKNIMNN